MWKTIIILIIEIVNREDDFEMIDKTRIMNPQAFISIFGDIPSLDTSELLDVQLRRDGPMLFLRLLTKEIIKIKPKRWDKWDVVYVEISFLGIRNLTINGFGTTNRINQFEINNGEDDGLLEIRCNNQMYIKCSFDWARVEQISPGLIGSP